MTMLTTRCNPIGSVPGSDTSPHTSPATAVADLHAHIDRRTATFARQTGLHCPPGCGRCCLSPDVETTIADALPLAEHIIQHGLAEHILDRLETATDARCVLYDADPADPARGRCSMYAVRPSICRLFGFAGRRDADGQPQFTACRIHTQTIPDIVAAARVAVAERRVSLPIFSDLSGQAAIAAPHLDSRPQPINNALRRAIHIVGLEAQLRRSLNDGDERPPDDHDITPPTPRIPPRQAA